MIYFVMGPPASGKGTQAARLAQTLDYPVVSTGELLRQKCHDNEHLAHHLHEGNLAPEAEITELLETLAQSYPHNVVIDGAPRTVGQVELIKKLWPHEAITVIWIDVADQVVRQRATHRREVEGVQRPDDREQAVEKRITIYRSTMQEITDALQKQTIRLIHLNGEGDRETIHQAIVKEATL